MQKMNENEMEQVIGGAGKIVGMTTPLGEYSAEQLIALYNGNPGGAASYVNLAKALCPSLITDFRNECAAKHLDVPKGLCDLLGIKVTWEVK